MSSRLGMQLQFRMEAILAQVHGREHGVIAYGRLGKPAILKDLLKVNPNIYNQLRMNLRLFLGLATDED